MAFPTSFHDRTRSANALAAFLLRVAVVMVAAHTAFPMPQGIANERIHTLEQNEKRSEVHPKFPMGRTKDSPPSSSPQNDPSICFPYFISQDVEALLSQASRMLSRALDDRQRSWLVLFVHRLEALSKQLRQLPAEHKNQCFQIRQRILGTDAEDFKPLDSLGLDRDGVEYQMAKNLLARQQVARDQMKNRQGQEYVTGSVSDGVESYHQQQELNSEIRKPIATADLSMASVLGRTDAEKVQKSLQSNNDPEVQLNAQIKDIETIISAKHPGHAENSVPTSVAQVKHDESRKLAAKPLPSIHPVSLSEVLENINWSPGGDVNKPFLPRSTRKTIPRPLIERMRSRTHSDGINADRDGSQDSRSSNPEGEVGHSSEGQDSQSANSNSEKEMRESAKRAAAPPPLLAFSPAQNRQEASQQSTASPDVDGRATESSVHTSSDTFEDDLVVMQLHSGAVPIAEVMEKKSDPRRLMSNMKPHSNPSESAPSYTSESPKSLEIDNMEEIGSTEEALMKTSSQSPPIHEADDANSLDFDYEEQGAAAGELFVDDESAPARTLAVPSSLEDLGNELKRNRAENEDEVVRQLQELRAPAMAQSIQAARPKDSVRARGAIRKMQSAVGLPLRKKDAGQGGEPRLIVDDK